MASEPLLSSQSKEGQEVGGEGRFHHGGREEDQQGEERRWKGLPLGDVGQEVKAHGKIQTR